MFLAIALSVSLLDLMDRGTAFDMSCDEIRQIESNRPDVKRIIPSKHVLVKHIDPNIKINYVCTGNSRYMAVAINNLSETEAISEITAVRNHYSQNGCAPGLDLIAGSDPESENARRATAMEPPRYAIWLTADRHRLVSAFRFPLQSDTFEVGISFGEPIAWPYQKPEVTDESCI